MPAPAIFSVFSSQVPRIITGVCLAAALVAALLSGGIYLRAALCLVAALALFEYFQMCWPGWKRIPGKIFGFVLCAALFCPATQREPLVAGIVLVLAFLWAALAFLFDFGSSNEAARFENHAILPLGILYIPLIIQFALTLSIKEQFLVVLAAIASDTAAYYAGCAFGRRKIWPLVSPKKSWEGSLAGCLAGVVTVMAIACIPFAGGTLHGGNVLAWLGVAFILNIAAQLGDFFESALKRSHGVKDSGSILPGHGGILDRIDAILFVLAAYSILRLVLMRGPELMRCLFPA